MQRKWFIGYTLMKSVFYLYIEEVVNRKTKKLCYLGQKSKSRYRWQVGANDMYTKTNGRVPKRKEKRSLHRDGRGITKRRGRVGKARREIQIEILHTFFSQGTSDDATSRRKRNREKSFLSSVVKISLSFLLCSLQYRLNF